MSEQFLVDTSVWIETLRPGGRQEITDWLREVLLKEAVTLAPPIRTEILLGARDEKQYAELAETLDVLPLLQGEEQKVWEQAASLGFRLRRQGLVIPLLDLLIVSWAAHYSCILAHRDRHFDLIARETPELKFLSFTKN